MSQPTKSKHESGAVAREEDLSPLLPDGSRRRILTGDRTTGKLHLGHYIGSLKNRVRLQETYDTFILMADVQALTTHYDRPEMIKPSVMDVALDYLAVGIDPQKATIVVQSMVPSIAELTVFYGLLVPVRSLIDNPTTKAEAEQYGYGIEESTNVDSFAVEAIRLATALKAELKEEHPEISSATEQQVISAVEQLTQSTDKIVREEFEYYVQYKKYENDVKSKRNLIEQLERHRDQAVMLRVQFPFIDTLDKYKLEMERNFAKIEQYITPSRDRVIEAQRALDSMPDWARLASVANSLNLHVSSATPPPKPAHMQRHDQLTMLMKEATYPLHRSQLIRRELLELIKKSLRQRGFSSMSYGFLGYPVSQAADITFVGGHLVPVGPDQVPLIELCREVVHRFNAQYGEKDAAGNIVDPILVEPQALLGTTELLRGLDGSLKMGKSLGNAIYLSDSTEQVWNQLRGAVTDPQRVRRTDPGRPEVCNIFAWHKVFNAEKEEAIAAAGLDVPSVEETATLCSTAGIGCVDCKKNLHTKLEAILQPIRERRAYWEARPDEVVDILKLGTRRANEEGQKTLARVKAAMHIDHFEL